MKIAVISITASGTLLSAKIAGSLIPKHDVDQYSFERYAPKNITAFSDLQLLVNKIFYEYDGLIFICAVGIAVRKIASLLDSKLTDPAVVAIDEGGKFAVSLVSGHIGGANSLTELIADKIGAVPVITTATDIGKKFSPDSFAAANHLHICDMETAKIIASEILNGSKIGIYSDFPYTGLPGEFTLKTAKYGICISDNANKKPFECTLNLIPKNISIGIGCKRNIDSKAFEDFVLKMLAQSNISINKIRYAATIDLKKDEKAIRYFSRKYSVPLKFYIAEQLMNVNGEFISSEFVKSITGADNICERSAAADGGKIIVHKLTENGMTFAAAINKTNLDFERRIY